MFGPDEPDDDLLWPPDFYEDFNSKVWMTYRHNYPPIRPSNHKTDIGWGCMLRSGQSLLANTLVMNFLSRGK
jgi:cysteine protease ATG4